MLGGVNMDAMKRVGLNTRWYRYQKGLTQEKFSEITNFKMAYISVIESGNANLTCRNPFHKEVHPL